MPPEFARRGFLLAGTAALAAPALARAALARSGRPGFFAARDIAEAGYVYGLPLVMNYGVMWDFVLDKTSGQYKAPFNQIANDHRVFTPADTAIVTPNSDTPYSMVWLDLRAEPVVISTPDVDPRRYFSVQLVDGDVYNYGYIGSRTTGSEAGHFLVAGPAWSGEAPEGVRKVFRSGTDFSLAIFRTQLFDPADMPNVIAVQDGYSVRPLSAFLGTEAPPAAPAIDFPAFTKDLAKLDFFEFLDIALTLSPGRPNETWIREQLARIGVGPGRSFDFHDLSLEDKAEILFGLEAGKRKVDEAVKGFGTKVNGWQIGAAAGDEAFFHGDWLLRAVMAQAGIYANDAAEATYPLAREDSEGRPLDGAAHAYTITFPKDGLPPVNAFWSITMYDGKTQLLVANPIDRYLINAPMLPELKLGADGSLTLYVQKDDPGPDRRANWLPAPDGPIYLVMRLYWPKTGDPSILPPGKGTWAPPPVVRTS